MYWISSGKKEGRKESLEKKKTSGNNYTVLL